MTATQGQGVKQERELGEIGGTANDEEEGEIGDMSNCMIEHITTKKQRNRRKRIIATQGQDVKKEKEHIQIGSMTKEKKEILVVQVMA